MFFRKMFIAGIILASCLGVLASPVDIAEYSLRSGPSTTPLVTPTSDVSGLERRVDGKHIITVLSESFLGLTGIELRSLRAWVHIC